MGIGDPGDRGDAIAKLIDDGEVGGLVVADGAHVDLRRHAEIQDLRDDVGRLEIENLLGEGRRQLLA